MAAKHSSAKTKNQAVAERVLNLLATLDHHAKRHGGPVDSTWLIERLPVYQQQQDPARRLYLDVLLLIKAGAPIEVLSESGKAHQYRLNDANVHREAIAFSREEAQVVALAAKLGTGTHIAALSRAGWTKIAASQEHLTQASPLQAFGDDAAISGEDYERILQAFSKDSALSFLYRRNPNDPAVERTLEPWHIIAVKDRHYLVGFDLDRQAPRSFRMTRISQVRRKAESRTHPVPSRQEAAEIVQSLLRQQRSTTTVRFRSSTSNPLSEKALREHGMFKLVDADRDELIRQAAALSPEVVIVEPEDVRQEVIELLRSAYQHHNQQQGGKP
ncbi:helix-turn-helix transcriptional regulator [Corynebacterium pelargi]|uniref:WYL domain-containing protein n=1 Tax=Corynebacterium pelargi TaxID=1471400 RepID=A0A410W8W9_9CORY|nr:WYL domain-containing protein [Corynebacterium pelargi]QAU52389.1 hypothetical protein CPELA_05590 [Corynebacterium pelargi]GGG68012.1 WYL domain-containing protein [Corynebacterium pelargi]